MTLGFSLFLFLLLFGAPIVFALGVSSLAILTLVMDVRPSSLSGSTPAWTASRSWRFRFRHRRLDHGRREASRGASSSVKRAATILQRSMVEVHPQLEGTKVEYAWGGKVAFTFDRMVHAGRADGVTYATGCWARRRDHALARDPDRRVGRRRGAAGDQFALVPARSGTVPGRRGSCRSRASTGKAKDRRDARQATAAKAPPPDHD